MSCKIVNILTCLECGFILTFMGAVEKKVQYGCTAYGECSNHGKIILEPIESEMLQCTWETQDNEKIKGE